MLLKKGNFRPIVRLLLVGGGAGIAYLGSLIPSNLLILFGLVVAGIGGYSSQASALGIKPFRDDIVNKKKRS